MVSTLLTAACVLSFDHSTPLHKQACNDVPCESSNVQMSDLAIVINFFNASGQIKMHISQELLFLYEGTVLCNKTQERNLQISNESGSFASIKGTTIKGSKC